MKVDGVKLRCLIAERQLPITEFARQARVSPATVYRGINTGKATISTIGKLAATLQVSPTEIFSAQISKEAD